MKVLIAEDDPVSRRLLQAHLTRWGHDVTAAVDGEEAWRYFQADTFSLVVTDWMMPEMDGLEFIRHIRSAPAHGYVFVIILTAKVGTDSLVEGMEAGADDFVSKPFHQDELRVRVEAGERVVNLERALAQQNQALLDAQEALRRHMEGLSTRLGRIMDASPHEIYVFDADTCHFVQVNQGACRNLGYAYPELMRLTPLDILQDFTLERYQAMLRPLTTGEMGALTVETLHRRKDGSVYPVEVRLVLSRTEDPPVFMAIAQDVSARARAEGEMAKAVTRLMQAEVDKREFFRDVIHAVTNGKFLLVDEDRIPTEGRLVIDVALHDDWTARGFRHRMLEEAEAAGMDRDMATDLLLAVAEAATNAVKHGGGGHCRIFVTDDRVIGRVSDNGSGISVQDLPSAVLLPGFSTKVSLGVGFTLMVRMVDRIYLATGPSGTVVQLEKWIRPGERPDAPIASALGRL